MGSASSKFKKHLQQGDEFAAMQIYHSSPQLINNVDPNLSYGENHNHNTALHYAAKHGMKHLVRTFLNDLDGNPNTKNGLNETVLHCACQLDHTKSSSAQERRASCVRLLLYPIGVPLDINERERVDLSAQDKEGNTALHWAASTGLKTCVEILITYGAPLIIENNDKLTPCDIATRAAHYDIASILESSIVFGDNTDTINGYEAISEQKEVYTGLRSQELRETKDQLLVDTSNMLKIPLFTAEALLRNNDWSKTTLLEKWMKDPEECCQSAGVQSPVTGLQYADFIDPNSSSKNWEDFSSRPEITCEICCLLINNREQHITMSCKHVFCKRCWKSYLRIKIHNGDAHRISCPAYHCHILVPVELIEKLVSPEMARRYLQFDINAFVESNKAIKWCPIAGCGRAVCLPEAEEFGALITNRAISVISHTVDCGNTHLFCWECLGEAHAPCSCEQWQKWQMKIARVNLEELQTSCSDSENAANIYWLVTNSKPCPNCKSPIQKNEGCNHIKCSKCKFDFCWVCQGSWTTHSSATGGYFRCNRFEAAHEVNEKQDSLVSKALQRNNQMQEMSRFLHFYTRFKTHENSRKLEEALLITLRQRMELLACSLELKSSEGTKFIEESVRELLKARRVLCGSYAYGYYLKDDSYNNTLFESMQNELEGVTEKLSEMIARAYLQTPKAVIIHATNLARRKRHEFDRAVTQGLISPETQPVERRAKKRYLKACLRESVSQWSEYDFDLEEEEPLLQRNESSRNRQCGANCSNLGCRAHADNDIELLVALELSRLQMNEDRIKRAQANATITPDRSSSVSNSDDESDNEIRFPIQSSLQDSMAAIHKTMRFQISEKCKKYIYYKSVPSGHLSIRKPGKRTIIRTNCNERRSHLDSNQSYQLDEKSENITPKSLALPSTSICTKQFELLDQTSAKEEVHRNQNSMEDTINFDSISSDIEVCEIWESATDDDSGSKASDENDDKLYNINIDYSSGYIKRMKKTLSLKCKKMKMKKNLFVSLKSKICSAYLPATDYLTRISMNKGLWSKRKKDELDEKQIRGIRRNSDHSYSRNN